jgi:hypothetical protein
MKTYFLADMPLYPLQQLNENEYLETGCIMYVLQLQGVLYILMQLECLLSIPPPSMEHTSSGRYKTV